jgi:hypothetical protein
MIVARLLHGPFDSATVVCKDDRTKWLFFEYTGPFTMQTKMAEWPHDHAPTGRPPLNRPVICYRLTKQNQLTGKAEFEYDESNSESIEEVSAQ